MKVTNFYLSLAVMLLSVSCIEAEREITVDQEFNQLINRNDGIITGTDGMMSIPLSDGKSMFLTGDAFMTKVVENQHPEGDKIVMGTSYIVVDAINGITQDYVKTYAENPDAMLNPAERDVDNRNDSQPWFWPGHGFQYKDVIHLFTDHYSLDSNSWWKFGGAYYIRISVSDFRKELSRELFEASLPSKCLKGEGVRYGMAVIHDDDYVYLYGCAPKCSETDLVGVRIARATLCEESNTLGDFTFYNGSSWVSDSSQSVDLKGFTTNIAEQFSVFKYKNSYVMLAHDRGWDHPGEIYTYTSESPVGPWSNKQLIYKPQESYLGKGIVTYNAMAHPQYLENDMLLMSYNVTSTDMSQIYEDATIYRPRFLRIPMEMIINVK